MIPRRILPVLGIAALLAGCATPKPIEPVTDLGARVCAPQPWGLGATALALDPDSARAATIDIAPDAPCRRNDQGTDSLYHVFMLPASDKPVMVTVSSMPVPRALFAPRLLLLDGMGRVTRQVDEHAFLFRGDMLTALVRLRADERMLVVESAPSVVGQPVSRVQEQLNSQVVVAYPFVAHVYTGSEMHTNYVMSHTGRIRVDLAPLPDAKLGQ
jgi:hypothetical protein